MLNHRSASQSELHLPKLIPKQKVGPKTSLSPPLSFHHSKSSVSRSSLEIPKPLKLSIASPNPTFLDHLIQKYISNRNSDSIDLTSKVQRVETLLFQWSFKNTYGATPGSRVSATLTPLSTDFYLFGGQCGERLSDLKLFNYSKLSWKTLPIPKDLESPEPRDGHIALPYKHFIVIYGGAGGYQSILNSRTCSPLLHMLDTQNLNWKTFKPAGRLADPRRNHSGAIIGNTFLIFGGINNNLEVLGDFQAVNLELMQWFPLKFKECSARLGPRHSFSMTAVFHSSVLKVANVDVYNVPNVFDEEFTKKNTGVYVFGGMDAAGKVMNDLYLVQAVKKQTRTDRNFLKIAKIDAVGQPPVARYAHSAGLCGKLLVVVGGRNDSLYCSSMQAAVGEVAAFNIAACRWEIVETMGTMPPAFWGIATAAVGTKLLCFGGMNLNSFACNDIWVLETSQDSPVKSFERRREGRRQGTRMKTVIQF